MRTIAIIFIFGCALGGIIAGICSGFGNYSAFKAMLAGTPGNWVWGWAGIAFTLTSAGAFGISFMKIEQGDWPQAVVPLIVGLIAACASTQGSKLHIDNGQAYQVEAAKKVEIGRARLADRISGWRTEMEDIPTGIGTAESLRLYMSEVERVGRSHQKPYRDAIIKLGHAEHRDSLMKKIDTAETALAEDPALQTVVPAKSVNGWLIAVLIELVNALGLAIAWAGAKTLYEQYRDAVFRASIEETFAE